MISESAFRPYYKPTISHTAASYDGQSQLYSSPEPMMSTSPAGGKERTRRRRTTFTPEQTATLEREYITDRYMDSSKRASLAESLNLNEVQVKTWFQNRRAKDKKEGRREEKLSPSLSSKTDSSATPPIPSTTEATSIQIPKQNPVMSPAIKAVLESPLSTISSPEGCKTASPIQIEPNVLNDEELHPIPLAPAPIPTSYADYLSLGLNPALTIPAPIQYSSIYDVYGGIGMQEYTGLLQPSNHFITSALQTLDPQGMNQQPLAQL